MIVTIKVIWQPRCHQEKGKGSSKLTWILAILLILVVLAPIIYVKISGDQSQWRLTLSNDRVVIQSTKRAVKFQNQRNHRRLPKPRRLQWPRHRQRRLSLVKHQALLPNKKNRPVHQRSLAEQASASTARQFIYRSSRR